jgi:hypothetical protein
MSPTLDALSAPMRGGSRKAPGRPCIDILRSGATTARPRPQDALRRRRRRTAADMRPVPSASPASSAAASPRPTIRRQALPSRVGEGSAKPSTLVRRTWGRRSRPEQSESADTRRRKPITFSGQPAGHFRPAVPRFAVPDKLKAYPSRSRAMASILTWASAPVRRVMSARVPSVS